MRKPQILRISAISISRIFLFSYVLLRSIPGILSSRFVTLGSIEIFKNHELLPSEPTVYFRCQGENKTVLPDVKEPLTELPNTKCKRCGLYEKDNLKSDDVYDEWELCPDEFVHGKYTHFKDNEFNATFICLACSAASGSTQNSSSNNEAAGNKSYVALVILISVLASVATIIGAMAVYRYLQKRKRERDQARFLKLFEESDGIEDELGLGHVI
uniref:DUF7953 domain-containing protein n=1 Tax=Ananas comosus var. bracteatus TaxID=296719 RepID=A0A6V7PD36_ANACO|nr:unnamed protein product [Ananas comosus var. bracteatus]